MGGGVIGKLDHRAVFSVPTESVDANGGIVNGWAEQFTRWAARHYLRGSEQVRAARLEGRQPVVLTVRLDSETETIKTDWKVEIGAAAYNVRTVEPHDDRMYLDLLCESGAAV